jgi:hypothetical protein
MIRLFPDKTVLVTIPLPAVTNAVPLSRSLLNVTTIR